MKTIYGILFTLSFFLLNGCSSVSTHQIDQQATAAAPWKVGEVVFTSAAGGDDVQCLFKDRIVTYCPYDRVFLGVDARGYYLLQEFFTPETVSMYLRSNATNKVLRTDPYWLTHKDSVTVGHPRGTIWYNTHIEGRIVVWYLAGGKFFEGEIKNKVNEGRWAFWRENGKKIADYGYLNGELHGVYKEWFRNGEKEREGIYEHGKKNGMWTYWTNSGRLLSKIKYVNDQEVK